MESDGEMLIGSEFDVSMQNHAKFRSRRSVVTLVSLLSAGVALTLLASTGGPQYLRNQIRGMSESVVLVEDSCKEKAKVDCDGCIDDQCNVCRAESLLTCCESNGKNREQCCQDEQVQSQAPPDWEKCQRTCHADWGADGQSCGVWQCCASAGFSCFAKHDWYAQCRKTCSTEEDAIDAGESWTCLKLGTGEETTAEQAQPPFEPLTCSMDGENCATNRCCQDADKTCYAKDDFWSGCRPTGTCKKGIWDVEEGKPWGTEWSCISNDVSVNPFKDSTGKHHFFAPGSRRHEYDTLIGKTSGKMQQNLRRMRDAPAAMWLWGKAAIPSLKNDLERAAGAAEKQTVVVIMYNIPNRDCAALASSGEICCKKVDGECSRSLDDSDDCTDGVLEYQTQFVDPVVELLQQYQETVRLVVVLEPDSLANLATNLDHPVCGHKATQNAYKGGIQYALRQLSTKVTSAGVYLDAAHGGWMGWTDSIDNLMHIIGDMKVPAFHGFATNVANYQPLGLQCPFCPDEGYRNAYCFKGQHAGDPCCDDPCGLAPQYNAGHSELNYAVSLNAAAKKILGMHARVVIDTGRNGNPKGRTNCHTWCNPRDMGAGVYPTANVHNASLVDAYFWFKTLGESDGCSEYLPDGAKCPRFDEQCAVPDSLATRQTEPRAPDAGNWYEYQVKMYAQFANFDQPQPGAGGAGSCEPLADTGTAVGGNAQVCSGPYDQCGGKNWTGARCCQTGCTCSKQGDIISRCEPPLGTTVCDAALAEKEPSLPPTPAPPALVAGCRVTTYRGKQCDGQQVKTYQTTSPKEYSWRWGYQENWPKSAKLEGNCKNVEFYDEDENERGYEDNIFHCGTGCVTFPYDLQEDLGGFYVEPGVPPAGGCTVTTWRGRGCTGKKVKTYSTGCVEEFKWHWGYQENWPKSASVVGTNCNKVEFYDEDWNHAGYGDNVWWHQGDAGCINLPWDLQEDLGGLKIWAS